MRKITREILLVIFISSLGCGSGLDVLRNDNQNNTGINSTSSGSTLLESKSWSFPADITDSVSPNNSDAGDPQVAISDNGDAIIVWSQIDSNGDSQIFKSEKRNGIWITPSSYDDNISPDFSNAYSAKVAMDSSGNTVIIWRQWDNTSAFHLYKREYRSGSWLGEPVLGVNEISSNPITSTGHDVAMSDNGDAVIIWRQTDGGFEQVYYSDYRSSSWSGGTNISASGTTNCTYPKLGMGDNGDAVITFQQDNGSYTLIYHNHYKSGAWSGTSSLGDTNKNAYMPILDMNSAGDILAVWEHTTLKTHVYYRFYDRASDSWTEVPTAGTNNISIDTQDASQKVCALNDNGDFVISWEESDSSNTQIYASDHLSGVLTNPLDLLNDNISVSGSDAGGKLAGIDSSGNAILVWAQNDGSNDQIYKANLLEGVWAKPSDINDHISVAGTSIVDKNMGMSKNGNTIIAWEQTRGANTLLYISYYENGIWYNPSSIDDFKSFDTYDTTSKAIAMDSNGNGIVVWKQGTAGNVHLYVSEFR